MRAGDTITLDVERPAVGGRMIARHDGRIVFVAGAIPGERVTARIARIQRQAVFADTIDVLRASPDRVAVSPGLECGGQVLAHVADTRQRALKGEMIADALRRLGHVTLAEPPPVIGGPADGYRTRARVHLRRGRAGFYDDGTHRLCELASSRQLTPASNEVVERLARAVAAAAPDLEAEIEWAENVPGTQRIAHLAVAEVSRARALERLPAVDGLDGCSWSRVDDPRDAVRQLWGIAAVVDELRGADGGTFAVAHGPRTFFQGNRFLLQALVDEVVRRLADGPVLDLYAGAGLFTLAAAATGREVMAVEGDAASAADLSQNAAGAAGVAWRQDAVEAYLAGRPTAVATVVVDPPRTGLSAATVAGLLRRRPPRVVYVSCDPATLARDLRALAAGGYEVGDVRGVDLFPRTGHVETLATVSLGR